jgi:hypothetical protein
MKNTHLNFARAVAMSCALAALLLSPPLAAQQGFSTIEERMTGKEFTAAGLEKLSPEELASLNSWLRSHSVATLETVNPDAQDYTDQRGFETKAAKDISDKDIVSAIKGEFSGWSGDTVFELENGMVWEQAEGGTFYIPAQTGAVAIIDKGLLGSWRLSIEGYNRTVRVKRIQ